MRYLKTLRVGLALSLLLPTVACAGLANFEDPRIAEARQRLAALPTIHPGDDLSASQEVARAAGLFAREISNNDAGMNAAIDRCQEEKVAMRNMMTNRTLGTQNRWEVGVLSKFQQCVNVVVAQRTQRFGGVGFGGYGMGGQGYGMGLGYGGRGY